MEEIQLQSKIEALLFYKGEDLSIKELSKILNQPEGNIKEALILLEESLVGRGLVLIHKDDSVALGTNPKLSDMINDIRKEEITKELSKASLETLSIILYKDGVTRSEIDYIRGVNSSFIIRNLLVRGLIERGFDKNDSRRVLYKPTIELISFMGVTSVDQIQDYKEIKDQLVGIMNSNNQIENNE